MKIKLKIIYQIVFVTILLTSETVLGVPANPEPFTITQPDNSSFQARQVGDERGVHFETVCVNTPHQSQRGVLNI